MNYYEMAAPWTPYKFSDEFFKMYSNYGSNRIHKNN